MNRTELKITAKKAMENKILILFALPLVAEIILWLILRIPIAGLVAVVLLTGPVNYAISGLFFNLIKKQKSPKFEDLLIGFKDDNFTRTFIAFIRIEVFTFLWSLLFIIPGIIKSIEYSQMYFIMLDHPKMTAGEAQRKSIEMMQGHRGEYFMLVLSFIPWLLLVGVTFGIAGIYVGPYMSTTFAAYYRKLADGKK